MSWNGDREPWEIPDREIYSSPEKDPWERKQPEQRQAAAPGRAAPPPPPAGRPPKAPPRQAPPRQAPPPRYVPVQARPAAPAKKKSGCALGLVILFVVVFVAVAAVIAFSFASESSSFSPEVFFQEEPVYEYEPEPEEKPLDSPDPAQWTQEYALDGCGLVFPMPGPVSLEEDEYGRYITYDGDNYDIYVSGTCFELEVPQDAAAKELAIQSFADSYFAPDEESDLEIITPLAMGVTSWGDVSGRITVEEGGMTSAYFFFFYQNDFHVVEYGFWEGSQAQEAYAYAFFDAIHEA